MTHKSSTAGKNHHDKQGNQQQQQQTANQNGNNGNQRNPTPKRGRGGGHGHRHEKGNGGPYQNHHQNAPPLSLLDTSVPPPPTLYGQPPPCLFAVPPPGYPPMNVPPPLQMKQIQRHHKVDNFPINAPTCRLEGGFEIKFAEQQKPKALLVTVIKLGSNGPLFVLSAILHENAGEVAKREAVRELIELIKQQQTEHSRVDPMNKASLPFLKDHFIVPLEKAPESFPDAVYYCEQCDYHISNILHARLHLDPAQDARHSDIKMRTTMREEVCRSFPALLPNQLTAIEKVLTEASSPETPEEGAEPFSLAAFATEMREKLLEIINKIPILEGKTVILEQYGSVPLGLDLPHSDVNYSLDVLGIDDSDSMDVISSIHDTLKEFQANAGAIRHHDILLSDGAFPRISFTLNATSDRSVNFVLSWKRQESVKFTRLVSLYLYHQPKLVELIRLVRKWARICCMFGSPTGLNKHAFDLMVIHFLQQKNKLTILHELQIFIVEADSLLTKEFTDKVKNMVGVSKTPFNIAELFVEFFKYYSEHRNEVVQIVQQAPLLKKETKWNNKVFQVSEPIRNENIVSFSKHFQPFFFNCILLTFIYFAVPRNKDGPLVETNVYQKLQESPRKKRKRDREAKENGGNAVRALGTDQQTPGKMEAHEKRWKAEGKREGEDAAEFVIKKADEALTESTKKRKHRRRSKKREAMDSEEEVEDTLEETVEVEEREPLTLKDFPNLIFDRRPLSKLEPKDYDVDDTVLLQYSRRTMFRLQHYVEPFHFTDEMRSSIAYCAEFLLDREAKVFDATTAECESRETSTCSSNTSKNECLRAAREILGPDATRNRIYFVAARLKINSTNTSVVCSSEAPSDVDASGETSSESSYQNTDDEDLKTLRAAEDNEEVVTDSEVNSKPEDKKDTEEENIWMKRAREELGPDADENRVLLTAARLIMTQPRKTDPETIPEESHGPKEEKPSPLEPNLKSIDIDWFAIARRSLGPAATANTVLLEAARLKVASTDCDLTASFDWLTLARNKMGPDAKDNEVLLLAARLKTTASFVATEANESVDWIDIARRRLGPEANENEVLRQAAVLKIGASKAKPEEKEVSQEEKRPASPLKEEENGNQSEDEEEGAEWRALARAQLGPDATDTQVLLMAARLKINSSKEEVVERCESIKSESSSIYWKTLAREQLGPEATDAKVLCTAARLKINSSKEEVVKRCESIKSESSSIDWMALARQELGPEATDAKVLCTAARLKVNSSKEQVVERAESVKSEASSVDWMALAREEMGPEANEDHVLILAARLKIAANPVVLNSDTTGKAAPNTSGDKEDEIKKVLEEPEEPDWMALAREKLGPAASENQILLLAAKLKINSANPMAEEETPKKNDAEPGVPSGIWGANGADDDIVEKAKKKILQSPQTTKTPKGPFEYLFRSLDAAGAKINPRNATKKRGEAEDGKAENDGPQLFGCGRYLEETAGCLVPTVNSITTHFEDLTVDSSIDHTVAEDDDGEESSALPDDFVFPSKATDKASSTLDEASTQEDEKESDSSTERICFEEFFVTLDDAKIVQELMEKAEAWSPEDYDYSFDRLENYTRGYMPDVKCQHCDSNKHDSDSCPQMKVPDIEEISYVRPESEWKEMDEMIQAYYQKAKVNDERRTRIMKYLKKIERNLAEKLPGARLEVFGSLMNGFGGANSDADICFRFASDTAPPDSDPKEVVKTINETLKVKMRNIFCQAILGAKVPIVKFTAKVDRDLSFEGDISFYNTLALSNTRMLKAYTEWAPERLPQLGLWVKNWAKACDIGDASKGSLSSYSYIIMMIHYLQNCEPPVLPRLQEDFKTAETEKEEHGDWDVYFHKEVEKGWSKNKQSVAQLFVGFLDYFSRFEYKTQVIQIRRKKPLLRAEKKWNRSINLEDPFDLRHNLGSGVTAKMFVFILKSIRISRSVFMKPMDKEWLDNLSAEILKACRAGNAPADRQCHRCHRVGHIADACPNKLIDRDRKMYGKDKYGSANRNRREADGEQHHQQQWRGERRDSIGGRTPDRWRNGAPWRQGTGMMDWTTAWDGFKNSGGRRHGGGRREWREFDRRDYREQDRNEIVDSRWRWLLAAAGSLAALTGGLVQGSQAAPAPCSNREFVYGILLDEVLEPDPAQGLCRWQMSSTPQPPSREAYSPKPDLC